MRSKKHRKRERERRRQIRWDNQVRTALRFGLGCRILSHTGKTDQTIRKEALVAVKYFARNWDRLIGPALKSNWGITVGPRARLLDVLRDSDVAARYVVDQIANIVIVSRMPSMDGPWSRYAVGSFIDYQRGELIVLIHHFVTQRVHVDGTVQNAYCLDPLKFNCATLEGKPLLLSQHALERIGERGNNSLTNCPMPPAALRSRVMFDLVTVRTWRPWRAVDGQLLGCQLIVPATWENDALSCLVRDRPMEPAEGLVIGYLPVVDVGPAWVAKTMLSPGQGGTNDTPQFTWMREQGMSYTEIRRLVGDSRGILRAAIEEDDDGPAPNTEWLRRWQAAGCGLFVETTGELREIEEALDTQSVRLEDLATTAAYGLH